VCTHTVIRITAVAATILLQHPLKLIAGTVVELGLTQKGAGFFSENAVWGVGLE
jgi:hypothetical protein